MSMNYGVVKPSFWTGATGRALRRDVDAQVVALYLMTSPHANIIGVFRCPIGYISAETGRPFEGASKGLLKLVAMGFCTVDPETETVWVHEMARFQIGEVLKGADKRVKHVARFFNEIENPRIKRAFFEKYGAAYQLVEPPASVEIGSPFEGASEIAASPIEATVTVTVTNTVTDTTHPSDGGEIQKSKPLAKISKRKPKPPTTPVPEGERLDALKLEFLVQADKRRIGPAEAKEQFERFIDHHRSKANEFADWHAAGRNWIRNSPKFSPKPGGSGGGGQRANGGFTQFLVNRAEQSNGAATIDHDDLEFSPR
ncbi:MAG: hypothetical protein JWQ94_554 [Tardiphaga sp.]|nr:hypothetical protein [Tardiphaga sp.]